MFVTEIESFVNKFHQLLNAGYNAHLDIESHLGKAWVSLRVQVEHGPGPLHHQVPPPFTNIPRKSGTSSQQRRRARRNAERQAAAAATAEEAPQTETAKVSIENIDDMEAIEKATIQGKIQETLLVENMNYMTKHRKEDTENFTDDVEHKNEEKENEVVDRNENVGKNESEHVHEQCQCKIPKGETIKCEICRKLYCDYCPAGPIRESENMLCLECLAGMFSPTPFLTSTPKKKSL